MHSIRKLAVVAVVTAVTFTLGSNAQAASADEIVAQHMVGAALLAAHLVAVAERAGMSPDEINAILKDVADKSAIDEFWITDPSGHAYLTTTGIDFTFEADPAKQPQASAFWPLIKGDKDIVIQEARKREIDDRVFMYVGVAGIDKSRIVQVGVSGEHLPGQE